MQHRWFFFLSKRSGWVFWSLSIQLWIIVIWGDYYRPCPMSLWSRKAPRSGGGLRCVCVPFLLLEKNSWFQPLTLFLFLGLATKVCKAGTGVLHPWKQCYDIIWSMFYLWQVSCRPAPTKGEWQCGGECLWLTVHCRQKPRMDGSFKRLQSLKGISLKLRWTKTTTTTNHHSRLLSGGYPLPQVKFTSNVFFCRSEPFASLVFTVSCITCLKKGKSSHQNTLQLWQ